MKTLKEMAAERKAERARDARELAKERKRAMAAERRKKLRSDDEKLVTIGKVTYSIAAIEEAIERAKQKKQKEYNDAIASGRSESCAIAVSTYYAGIIVKRYTTMLACAHSTAMSHKKRTYKQHGNRNGKPDHNRASPQDLRIESQPLE